MSYKVTDDHVFKRILVFQFAMVFIILSGFCGYFFIFIAKDFASKLAIILLITLFMVGAFWLFRDAFRADKNKIDNTLDMMGGGSELLGILILVIVYLLFG